MKSIRYLLSLCVFSFFTICLTVMILGILYLLWDGMTMTQSLTVFYLRTVLIVGIGWTLSWMFVEQSRPRPIMRYSRM